MAQQFRSSGKVSPLAAPVWIVGLACAAVLGGAYRLAVVNNPYGVANILLAIIAVFALGFVTVQSTRLGKVRHGGVAFLLGVLAVLAFQIAGLIVIERAVGGHGWWSALQTRWTNGVPMFGSAWVIHGGWMWPAMLLEWTIVLLTAGATAGVESQRPFCEKCRAWARGGRWSCRVKEPSAVSIADLKKLQNVPSLLRIIPGGGARGHLLTTLGACHCGRLATLKAALVKRSEKGEESKDEILSDLTITPAALAQVYAWGERVDPASAARRPAAALAQGSTEPLAREPAPEHGSEFTSTARWDGGSMRYFHSYANNEYTKAVRDRLAQGHFQIAEEAIRAQRRADDLACVAEACADWEDRPTWLDDWELADPESRFLPLVTGIWIAKSAWRARGGGWKPKDFSRFMRSSEEADTLLAKACERVPKDPTPWAWRIVSSFAQNRDPTSTRELLTQALARAPHHRFAHTAMLWHLSWRWFGSPNEAFALAREALRVSPAGSSLPVVIPEVHIDVAAQVAREKGKQAVSGYWMNPEVGAELRRANTLAFRADKFRPCMDTPRTRAYFAYTLWKSRQFDVAAEHLRVIGTSTPWYPFSPNLPFSNESVRRARKECGVA